MRSRRFNNKVLKQLLLPLVIVLAGFAFSVIAFVAVQDWERYKVRTEFEKMAHSRHSALKKELEFNLHVATSLKAFYRHSHEVERSEFQGFVEPFLCRYHSIKALEWAPRIEDTIRVSFESEVRGDGFPHFTITELGENERIVGASKREEYFPVSFVEPLRGNEAALGFDLASSSVRREAMEHSRDTGEMAATGRIKLIQENGAEFSFLLFAPLYQKGSTLNSVEDRRKQLTGFVLGVYRIGDIVEKALSYLDPEGIDITVYDKSAPEGEQLLYFHPSRMRKDEKVFEGGGPEASGERLDLTWPIDVAGRQWLVRYAPAGGYFQDHKTWSPWGVLAAGLLFTALLASHIILNLNRSRRLEGEIAERKQSEAALVKSEERYRRLVEMSPEMIAVHCEGKYVYVNPAGARLLGANAPSDLIGKSILDFVHPDNRNDVKVRVHRTQSEGLSVPLMEQKLVRLDGRTIVAEVVGIPASWQGNPATQIIVRDVTEHRLSDEALKESEARYKSLFENNHAAMLMIDPKDGSIVDANPAATIFYGYDRMEMQRLGISDINRFSKDRIFAEMQNAKAERCNHFYFVHRLASGELRDVEVYSGPIRVHGRELLYSIVHDISERKRIEEALKSSEENMRRIIESSPVGIRICQKECYVYVNPAFARMFCFDKPEDVIGLPFEDLYAPEDREWVKRKLANMRHEQATAIAYEAKGIARNGRRLDLSIWVTEIEYHGKLASLAFVVDVSSEKELRARLNQAQKLEAIGTLAGGIAHDFNNILGIILGYTELTSFDIPPGTKARQNLAEVVKAAGRAKDLVSQILTFSRRGEQEQKPLKVESVVKEALKMLRASLPSTIEIRQIMDVPQGGGTILADPTQIHQVLMNLCTNAGHAMQEKGGVLEVILSPSYFDSGDPNLPEGLNAGAYLRLSVRDTGHGISPAVLERIFEPYFTTKGLGEGTGLGLAVVHGIVQSHGGAITVQSDPGKGTTFDVFFPVIEKQADPCGVTTVLPTLPSGNECVLLVDDEVSLVDTGRQMLERLGYRVTARTSSIEALEIFQGCPERFDLVVTDQTMPQMTGTELAREITRIRPGIPVILCSGFSHMATVQSKHSTGIREFVMKPLVLKDLAETVRKVLDEKAIE